MNPDGSPTPIHRAGRMLGHLPAAALLGLAFWMAISAAKSMGPTSDEPFHITAGYAYWKTGQFRMHAENGNLPQRLLALPLLWSNPALPPTSNQSWRESSVETYGREFFYDMGNDPDRLLMSGRWMTACLMVLLMLATYLWALRLLGWGGAMIALFAAAFCPLLLGHGALATSDLCAALFFLLATGSLWRLMHRVTPATILAATAAVGGLALSKFSAPLIVPIAGLLLALRWKAGRPLLIGGWNARGTVESKSRQAAILAGALIIVAIGAWIAIWAAYDFRYATFVESERAAGHEFINSWAFMKEKSSLSLSLVYLANDLRLLPESYCWGQAHTLRASVRNAYALGQFSPNGWGWYFPLALSVKTPISMMLLWLGGWIRLARNAEFKTHRYEFLPLMVLLMVYFSSAVIGGLNIGLRHLLPIYPVLFIVAGAMVRTWAAPTGKVVLPMLLLGLAGESLAGRPDYLAYFNAPSSAMVPVHRLLADSNLDWGQDLPAARRWIERRNRLEPDTPIHFAYFGPADLNYYRLPAILLQSFPKQRGYDADPEITPLRPGYYCVSVNLLVGIYHMMRGPWNIEFESNYQKIRMLLPLFDQAPRGSENRRRIRQIMSIEDMATIQTMREERLLALLRQRPPDDRISPSILVYKVTAEEIQQAIYGPPAEMKTNPLLVD